MLKIRLLLTIFLLNALICIIAQDSTHIINVANDMDYNYFFKNVEYLASDALKGRNTGSEEYAIAAEYVANEFQKNGLKAFGDNGSYFQKVPMVKATLIDSSLNIIIENTHTRIKGKHGDNISILTNPVNDYFNQKQELVFAGYGNIIAEDSINDYKGIDVKGKTVIVALGGPKSTKHSSYNNPFSKLENAVNQGARGIIVFSTKKIIQGIIFKKLHKYIGGSRIALSDTSVSKPLVDLDIVAYAKKDLIKDILKADGIDFNKELKSMANGNFRSKVLNADISCSYKLQLKNNDCKNVVGILPGSDIDLKNEYVVVGAHLDHLGIGKKVKGDSIYNGMWDNATGVAAIISIAKAFNDSGIQPKRSIIFIAYTGEEKGLFGSHYYASKNAIDSGKIVANVNIDMLGSLYETTDVTPIGYTHSNLSEALDFAANSLNLTINNMEEIERMIIGRSDQFSFIQIGAPPVYFVSGVNAVNPKINVRKNLEKWMKKTYHSPFDDLNQEYSEVAFLNAIKVNFLTTYYTAHELEKIQWNKESWIYKKYILKNNLK